MTLFGLDLTFDYISYLFFFPSDPPETPRSCELRNDTVLEVVCVAGSDGGLSQYFVLEVVGGDPMYGVNDATRSFNDANPGENEISTMNDQVRQKNRIFLGIPIQYANKISSI